MAISGLVVTLSSIEGDALRAIERIEQDSRLTLGQRFGQRVALVAETGGVDEDRALWDDLHAIDGVEEVHLTFVGLEETRAEQEDSDDNC